MQFEFKNRGLKVSAQARVNKLDDGSDDDGSDDVLPGDCYVGRFLLQRWRK